jgi:hypothetical protein
MKYILEKIVVILLTFVALGISYKIYQTYLMIEKKKEHNAQLKKKHALAKKIQSELTSQLMD